MFLPIIRIGKVEGANGRNWPGIAIVNRNAPYRAAVAAQEAVEAMFKLNPIALLRRTFSRSYRRRMEILGHEAEVQAAWLFYGRDRHDHRTSEVSAMKRGYAGLFDGMTHKQIYQAMQDQSDNAMRKVRDLNSKLQPLI